MVVIFRMAKVALVVNCVHLKNICFAKSGFAYWKTIPTQATGGVNSAPHRKRNIFSRVAQDTSGEANNGVPQKNCLSFSRIMSHSHSSLLDLPLFSHPQLLYFYHLAATINHLIHGPQDCLVVWPYKVRSQFRTELI